MRNCRREPVSNLLMSRLTLRYSFKISTNFQLTAGFWSTSHPAIPKLSYWKKLWVATSHWRRWSRQIVKSRQSPRCFWLSPQLRNRMRIRWFRVDWTLLSGLIAPLRNVYEDLMDAGSTLQTQLLVTTYSTRCLRVTKLLYVNVFCL